MKDSIIKRAEVFINSMDVYFEVHPTTFYIFMWLIKNDPKKLDSAVDGIKQIQKGIGFSIDSPLTDISIAGCYGLIDMLELQETKRKSHYNFLKEGYIIDEFDLENESGEKIKIFNRIKAGKKPKKRTKKIT